MENKENIKVIPLGGVEEIGINSTAYEYQGDIMVVDLGLGFPGSSMYGVDFLVPNTDYLERRKEQLRGIVITHGHLDHIGGLPYLLPRLGFPKVYGTQFTIELIKAKMSDFDIVDKCKFEVITESSQIQLGKFDLSFFRVNHSIPQCVGVVINTPAARVVQTGDFKFDNSPVNEPVADYARIAQVGMTGVDLLLSDSTNSLRKGHPISEGEVAGSLEDIIERAKGRVVMASFSGLVGRLYQVMQIAEKHKRKIAIAGYSMNQTIRIAQEIGYIKPAPGLLVPIQKINRYHDDRIIILTTGAQGESNAALFRMASSDYKNVKIKKGDTIVISAGTIPGNHTAVQDLLELLYQRGALVHQSENMDFFTSGHGYQEDQKIMLNLVKPKFFMPVHGYQYFLREHGRTATQVGIKEQNVLITKRGQVIEGNKHDGFRSTGQVRSLPILISGTGIGDVGASVLEERKQLGNHGVIVIDITIDRDRKQLVSTPHVATKGFVYVKTSRDLLEDVRELAESTINKQMKRTMELSELRKELEHKISSLVNKEIGRDPMILSMITFVSGKEPGRTRQKPIAKPRKPLKEDTQPQHTPQPEQQRVDIAQKWGIPKDSLDLIDNRRTLI